MQIDGITETYASQDHRQLLRKQTFSMALDRKCFSRCEVFIVSVCQVQNVGVLSTTESSINIPVCQRVSRA